MAVHIPIVVDIDKAFQDAAKRVEQAMRPLRAKLSSGALTLRLRVDKSSVKTVQELLDDPLVSAQQLKNAIADIESQIRRMQSAGQFKSGHLTGIERDMLNIYTQLQMKITGTTDVLTQFGRTVGAQRGQVRGLTSDLKKQNGVLSGLIASFSAYVSMHSLLRFVKQIRDVTGELEYQRVALGHLIEDEEYGNKLFNDIKAAAKESPFRITQLTTYTKQLAAFRVEQDELFGTMMRLADVSAGLGVDMNRLILAYGQVRAASVLRGQELRQFTEAGIPLVDLLAEKFSELNGKVVKTADVFKLISQRAVPFSMISEIFEDLTDKGGMFYEMQKTQADTLRGKWEKLKDAFDIGLQSVGETESFVKANDKVLKILNKLANNLNVIPKSIAAITAAFVSYKTIMVAVNIVTNRAIILQKLLAAGRTAIALVTGKVSIKEFVLATQSVLLAKAQGRLAAATNRVSAAFWKMNIALISNPIVAIVSAVLGAIVMFKSFKTQVDETSTKLEALDKVIEKTSSGLKEHAKLNKVITRYETLATKTERTVKEQDRLYETMIRLKDEFPKVALSMDSETDSIERQVTALREENNERERKIRLEGETTLKAEKISLQSLREKRMEQQANKDIIMEDIERLEEKGNKVLLRNRVALLDKVNQELAETDSAIIKLQKRVQRLYYILHPESAESPWNAWQKYIVEMRDITIDGVTSQLFTDEDIEKWESLDDALAEIEKRKSQAQKVEDTLTNSIKNQTGAIREQLEADLEQARAERIRLETMEEFFKTPTLFAQSLSKNFSDALLRTFDEGNIKAWGKAALGYLTMQTNILFNPDLLLARPLVDAAELVKKGWEEAGEGIATVFSSTYDWEDEHGNKHNLMVTPILPDGSILSPEELDDYVKNVLLASNLENDDKQLLLGIDVTPDAGERLHEMQERYYEMLQMSQDLPKEFLISDKDLLGLEQATDVIVLVEQKIKSIKDEIKKVKSVNIEAIPAAEAEKTQNYLKNLEKVYDILKRIRDLYKSGDYSNLAQEIVENFNDALARNFDSEEGIKSKVATDFMITDQELQDIYNLPDLFDILDKKITNIRKEIETASKQNLDNVITDEAREDAEAYRLSLQEILDLLLQMRSRYQNVYSSLSKEIQQSFPTLMESYYAGKDKGTFATTGLFSDADLIRLNNIVDLFDLLPAKYHAVNAALEKYNGELKETVDIENRRNILAIIAQLNADKKSIEELAEMYGIVLEKIKGTNSSSADPWILIYKNRLKFVQDFSKGVEDLNTVMTKNNAIAKEREIMEGRGLNLGFNGKDEIDVRQMTGSRAEVMKWYEDTIKKIQAKIAKLGGKMWAGLGVQAILAKDTKNRALKAWQDLLADVFKQQTDYDLSEQKQQIVKAIDKLKEEIKRTDAAHKFFEDIFATTGDRDLATNMTISVYGNPGSEFADRIKRSIGGALEKAKVDDVLKNNLLQAAETLDFSKVMENFEDIPKELQSVVKEAAEAVEKYNIGLLKNFADLSVKYGEAAQKMATVSAKIQKQIDDVVAARDKMLENKKLTPKEKQAINDRADEVIKALRGEEALELKKLSDEYTKYFAEINVMTAEQTVLVRKDLREAYLKAFTDGAISADELYKNLRAIDTQFKKLNSNRNLLEAYLSGGIDKANEKLLDYAGTITVISQKMKGGKTLDSGEIDFVSRMLKSFGGDETRGAKNYEELIAAFSGEGEGLQAAGKAFGSMGKGMSAMAANGPGALAIVDAIIKAVHGTIQGIQQIIDQLNEVRSEENKIGEGFKYLSDFDKYTFSGWEKLKSGDAIGATADAISSYISIFNNIQKDKVEDLNDSIEEQNELLENLEYSYSRLGSALEKAFGSDYIQHFNGQLAVLEAQADAYREQARLEREKGKSADEKVAKDYERQAREVEDKIKDSQSQLAEFFAGTDVTSAATDFANAWIEAYKEFGSTSDALSEKFEDMIQNMVVNSMAAKIVQDNLKDVFKLIDDLAKEGGELSVADAAIIANRTKEVTGSLNSSLTNLMTALGGVGLNLRSMGTGLTGIARDIQGASEESILGLAAGVNTQNYYMQHIDMNVAMILAALTGTAPVSGAPAASVADPYRDQMLAYVSSLPQMRDDMASIRVMLERVIRPNGSPATHYVAAKM